MSKNEQPWRVTAIIADDESLSIDLVREFLKKWKQIEVISECSNGLSTLNDILEYKPDLVFLDIQMPDLNGFEVLKEIPEENVPKIIFISAFDKYAIKAFETSAIDYLLKPLNQDRFDKAVLKGIKNFGESKNTTDSIIRLIAEYSKNFQQAKQDQYLTRILIKEGRKLVFLYARDIDWIEASGDYAKIHSKEKHSLVNMSLTELDKKLDPLQFIRIHRSSIVNIDFIKELHPYSNGEFNLVLKNEVTLRLSRTFKDRIKPYMDKTV